MCSRTNHSRARTTLARTVPVGSGSPGLPQPKVSAMTHRLRRRRVFAATFGGSSGHGCIFSRSCRRSMRLNVLGLWWSSQWTETRRMSARSSDAATSSSSAPRRRVRVVDKSLPLDRCHRDLRLGVETMSTCRLGAGPPPSFADRVELGSACEAEAHVASPPKSALTARGNWTMTCAVLAVGIVHDLGLGSLPDVVTIVQWTCNMYMSNSHVQVHVPRLGYRHRRPTAATWTTRRGRSSRLAQGQ